MLAGLAVANGGCRVPKTHTLAGGTTPRESEPVVVCWCPIHADNVVNAVTLATDASRRKLDERAAKVVVVDDQLSDADAAAALANIAATDRPVEVIAAGVVRESVFPVSFAHAPIIRIASTVDAAPENVVSIAASHTTEARIAATFAFGEGWRSAVVFLDQNAGVRELAEWFLGEFETRGGKVKAINFDEGQTKFDAQVQSLLQAHPDVVFFAGDATDASALIKQAIAAGVKTTFLGTHAWSDSASISVLPDSGEMLFVTQFSTEDPAAAAFVSAFRSRFGADPTALDAAAYDAVVVALAANARAGNSGDLLAAIKATDRTMVPLSHGQLHVHGIYAVPVAGLPIFKLSHGKATYLQRVEDPPFAH